MFCPTCGSKMVNGSRFCAACGAAVNLGERQAVNAPSAIAAAHQDVAGVAGKDLPSDVGVPVDGGSNRSFARVWLIGGATAALVLLLVAVASLSGQDASDTVAHTSATGSVIFSMRPVLGEYATSPALRDPTMTRPAGDTTTDPILQPLNEVDPEIGLSMVDEIEKRSFLEHEESGLVYEVGGIFVELQDGFIVEFPTGADIIGAQARFSSTDFGGQWVVVPVFTDEGGEKFRQATAYLAGYPVGDPRRQLAIVVDGVVLSAPAVAFEVSPVEGLDPDAVIITVGMGDTAEQDAEALALALRGSA